jgi:hypothetical protein
MTDHINPTAVCADDCACDRQPHARALQTLPVTAPAVKLIEDEWLLRFIDSLPFIPYAH